MPVAALPCFMRRCPLAAAALLLASCARPLPPAAYRAYLADPAHGLRHTREAHGASIACAYRPMALLVLQDLATAPASLPPTARDSAARAYAGKTYCALTLARNGGEIENAFVNDPAAYQQALAYLNTGLAADTYLATSAQDSVPGFASMYLRQYGTTGASTVLLVFDTAKLHPENGFHLTWHDTRFGLGTQRFAFAADDLAALPELRYD